MSLSDSLAKQFQNLFERLINREKVELNNPDVSLLFEVSAENLLKEVCSEMGIYFDGVVNVTSAIRKTQQIVLQGEMWIGKDQKQWKEPFKMFVTDKRLSKQDIQIKMQIGSYTAEGNLQKAFGFSD